MTFLPGTYSESLSQENLKANKEVSLKISCCMHAINLQWLWDAPTQELSWPGKRMSHPRYNLSFWQERGWPLPLVEDAPAWLFIGIGTRRGKQHTCIAYKSMSKGYNYQKQILSIDNNWRNTEIYIRSGSVQHADIRRLLRSISWDKEFTPYAWN